MKKDSAAHGRLRANFRASLLLLACTVHATFSSSTPNHFGIAELIVAGLLLILAFQGSKDIFDEIALFRPFAFIMIPMIAALILGTLQSLWNSLLFEFYIRDVVPFVFLFIPFFFIRDLRERPNYVAVSFFVSSLVIAAGFSVRHFLTAGVVIGQIGLERFFVGIEYFPQDPAVQYAAVISGAVLMVSFRNFSQYWRFSFSFKFAALVAGALSLLATISIGTRAPPIMAFMLVVLFLSLASMKRPSVMLATLLVVVGLLPAFGLTILELLQERYFALVIEKFAYGWNSRDLELFYFIEFLKTNFWGALFGIGWGGFFENPGAARDGARFAHNAFIYLGYKVGLFGLILMLPYFWMIVVGIRSMTRLKSDCFSLILIGTVTVILLNIMLQPGIKMLSFSLLMGQLMAVVQMRRISIRRELMASSRPHKMAISSSV